ncbi:MAG: DUF3575 domain-containing protein [Mucinivorans sp.]
MKFFVTLLLVVFLSITTAWAQNHEFTAKLFFRDGSSVVEEPYDGNGERLHTIISRLRQLTSDSTLIIRSFTLEASTSPTGKWSFNQLLAQKRYDAIERYLRGFVSLPDSVIHRVNGGIAYHNLRDSVAASDYPYRDTVVYLIDHTPEFIYDQHHNWVDGLKRQLMSLHGGRTWNSMADRFFPAMRYTMVSITVGTAPVPMEPKRTLPTIAAAPVETLIKKPATQPLSPFVPSTPYVSLRVPAKPILAIKTNLLYDALTALNLELELPIGRHWSIAGQVIFPWWKSNSANMTLQLFTASIQGRYWFGERTHREPLTGWNIGLYVGGGLFDVQPFTPRGVQGEFFIAAGLSAAYAHSIGNNLRLEYSLGVGYMQTNYRRYTMTRDTRYGDIKVWDYPWQTNRHRWFGPTKLEVSLVWLINSRHKNRVGR